MLSKKTILGLEQPILGRKGCAYVEQPPCQPKKIYPARWAGRLFS